MEAVERARRNLHLHSAEPLNGEPPPDRLATFITPQRDFYIRCHRVIPRLKPDDAIKIAGLVGRPNAISIADLKTSFPEKHVTAVLQCAGNRRSELQVVGKTAGDPWGVGVIG